jgi:hypothetical protein
MAKMPRIQRVLVPILRTWPAIVARGNVTVETWIPDLDYRTFPLINLRRVGGNRNINQPLLHSAPVVEMTVYGTVNLPDTENLYEDALEALYDAAWRATVIPTVGALSGIKETMGATELASPFQDSWRIQGLIKLGLRPLPPPPTH